VHDLAQASLFLMKHYDGEQHVNVGTGLDVPLKELAETVKEMVGFTGQLVFNTEKPDGTPRKLLDVSKINNLGWKHKIELREGIKMVIDDLAANNFSFARS